MKATRSTKPKPEWDSVEHKLEVDVGGTLFVICHVIPNRTYHALDVKDTARLIDTFLWDSMMKTIEHNIRKNLTHA